MPCDTITTANVHLGKVDATRLKEAAESLGYRVGRNRAGETVLTRYSTRVTVHADGEATVAGYAGDAEWTIAELKREVARATVNAAVRRFGYRVKAEERTELSVKLRIGKGR